MPRPRPGPHRRRARRRGRARRCPRVRPAARRRPGVRRRLVRRTGTATADGLLRALDQAVGTARRARRAGTGRLARRTDPRGGAGDRTVPTPAAVALRAARADRCSRGRPCCSAVRSSAPTPAAGPPRPGRAQPGGARRSPSCWRPGRAGPSGRAEAARRCAARPGHGAAPCWSTRTPTCSPRTGRSGSPAPAPTWCWSADRGAAALAAALSDRAVEPVGRRHRLSRAVGRLRPPRTPSPLADHAAGRLCHSVHATLPDGVTDVHGLLHPGPTSPMPALLVVGRRTASPDRRARSARGAAPTTTWPPRATPPWRCDCSATSGAHLVPAARSSSADAARP